MAETSTKATIWGAAIGAAATISVAVIAGVFSLHQAEKSKVPVQTAQQPQPGPPTIVVSPSIPITVNNNIATEKPQPLEAPHSQATSSPQTESPSRAQSSPQTRDSSEKQEPQNAVQNSLLSGQWAVVSRRGTNILLLRFMGNSTCTIGGPITVWAAGTGIACHWSFQQSALRISLTVHGRPLNGYSLEPDGDASFQGSEDMNGGTMGAAQMRRP
jgi:hypothetical protein